MQKSDGMNYAPKGRPAPVVQRGEFAFAAAALDHGHIFGMANGLAEAGGVCKYVYDADPKKAEAFAAQYPEAKIARSLDEILLDKDVRMVAAAAVPNLRGPLGLKVMDAGKDYFTDKTPFTAMEQLFAAREKCARTGRRYMVYYSERVHTECGVCAGYLIKDGVIGDVIQVLGTGPHRLNAPSRPDWFFRKEQYGGILCDIGSHQAEQFLYYAGAKDAKVMYSQVGNFAHPEYPELEDFGDATLVADNGAANYFRVDWFTPDGLKSWGDGRAFILGTKGFMELRKYTNIGVDGEGDQIFLATEKGEEVLRVAGKIGFPFFGELILDCLERTEKAMTQEHAFKAAELCLEAQAKAV
ncbi:MAG: Gfo/Idh/MocA family oxidoreductase, partial [Firmicutes bacterium]|nr:Gfo/Idh/MocA family oxidoreductase [Bacillota bacterium]